MKDFSHVYDDGNKLQLDIKHTTKFPTSRLEDEGLVVEQTCLDC